jgi:hypothetical protein
MIGHWRLAVLAVVTLPLCAGPAAAQSASREVASVAGSPLSLDLPPPADTGKPRAFVLPPVMPPPAGCTAAFDCRVRVIGTVQHDGAVELNATALKW